METTNQSSLRRRKSVDFFKYIKDHNKHIENTFCDLYRHIDNLEEEISTLHIDLGKSLLINEKNKKINSENKSIEMLRRVVYAYQKARWASGESEASAIETASSFLYDNDPVFKQKQDISMRPYLEDRPLEENDNIANSFKENISQNTSK